jgi:GTPase
VCIAWSSPVRNTLGKHCHPSPVYSSTTRITDLSSSVSSDDDVDQTQKGDKASIVKSNSSNNSRVVDEQRSIRASLLNQLDDAFDYEGRLPSKLTVDVRTTAIETQQPPPFRCGFVSIIGAANMGKSTLLNSLLQEDLCIATRRPQTTRHAILGVLSTQYSQVCLLDTPGVLDGPPAYKLQERMMEAVKGAVNSADILLVVSDMFSTPLPDYDALFQKVQASRKPVIVAINKIDLVGRATPSNSNVASLDDKNDDIDGDDIEKTYSVPDAVAKWRKLLPNALAIIPLCAAAQDQKEETDQTEEFSSQHPGVHLLRQILIGGDDIPASIRAFGRPIPGMFQPGVTFLSDEDAKALLPEGPPLYDEESISDRSERFFVSELIRESLFDCLQKELPYSCEVQVTNFKEPTGTSKNEKTQIEATVFVERDSQKIIVVGKGGMKIKEIGTKARTKIERFLGDGMKVNLNLLVSVKKDWRKKDDQLKEFGYQTSK